MHTNTVIFLADGMADEPVPQLGGKTPLQAANTPSMDYIAQNGCCGTLKTLPEGFPTSSEVANMSVLGCDVETEYCGRGPFEAAGRGIDLGPEDKAFRLNLTTTKDGILTDYSGGHLSQADSERIIYALDAELGSENVKFRSGVSYRNLLILSGPQYSHLVKTDKPDDNQGEPVANHLPSSDNPEAKETVELLLNLIEKAPAIIDPLKTTANGIWPWSGGQTGSLKSLREKYNINGAVISAVDVINGLGKCLGMTVINVPGATGYIDTNYDGKAQAAIKALSEYDLVYLHLEAIDEVSHEQNLELKLKAIEDFDSKIIAPVLKACGDSINVAVLPDHPVPVLLGKHTRVPVPVAVKMSGMTPDDVMVYDELSCVNGALGAMTNGDLMDVLFPQEH
ncbi:cofactor-independent phosphoglycerate mutase [bacterium E08(2017)]|nr:cofactor-independent phosphoglycerate mutase [bacterium E08(2017)]